MDILDLSFRMPLQPCIQLRLQLLDIRGILGIKANLLLHGNRVYIHQQAVDG